MRTWVRKNPWIWIVLFLVIAMTIDIVFVILSTQAWEGVEVVSE